MILWYNDIVQFSYNRNNCIIYRSYITTIKCPFSAIVGRRLGILQRILCSGSGPCSFRHPLLILRQQIHHNPHPQNRHLLILVQNKKLSKLQGLIWRSSSSVWKVDLMAAGACFSTSLFPRPAWPHSPHSLLIQLHCETTKCSFSKMRSQIFLKDGGLYLKTYGQSKHLKREHVHPYIYHTFGFLCRR